MEQFRLAMLLLLVLALSCCVHVTVSWGGPVTRRSTTTSRVFEGHRALTTPKVNVNSNRHRRRRLSLTPLGMSPYVPPEEDEEYRSIVKKSLQRPLRTAASDGGGGAVIDVEASLPIPKEGDIVLCPGVWKGERVLARIRFLQYSTARSCWSAEVSPLAEGKSVDVFTTDKKAKPLVVNVTDLQPVRAMFVRSENGYRVNRKTNSTELLTRAPKYKTLPADYVVPTKPLNMTTLEEDLVRYEALKTRIVVSTAQFGAVGTAVAAFFFGPDVAIPFFLGSGAGAAYLYLLGKKTDSIGAMYSKANSSTAAAAVAMDGVGGGLALPGRLNEALVNARFFVPVIVLALFAAKNYFVDGEELQPFQLVSRQQFLGVASGFLSNRIALFLTEIRAEMRTEDILSIVPGSLAETYRQSKRLESTGRQPAVVSTLSTVVVITGPRAAGRSSLTSRLLANGKVAGKLQVCRYLTTDTGAWQRDPTRFKLVTDDELAALRTAGKLLYEGQEKGLFGAFVPVALSADDVTGASEGPTAGLPTARLVEGPPEVIEALGKVATLRLLNIWISLQTKEQFIEKASVQVQTQLRAMMDVGRPASAQESAAQVSDLVNEAAQDVSFFMSKAPLFEYTLLNSGTEEETLDELEVLLSTAL